MPRPRLVLKNRVRPRLSTWHRTRRCLVIIGGPTIYLAGNALFNSTVLGLLPRSRLMAICVLALLALPAAALTPLVLFAAATLVPLILGFSKGTPRRLLVGAQPG